MDLSLSLSRCGAIFLGNGGKVYRGRGEKSSSCSRPQLLFFTDGGGAFFDLHAILLLFLSLFLLHAFLFFVKVPSASSYYVMLIRYTFGRKRNIHNKTLTGQLNLNWGSLMQFFVCLWSPYSRSHKLALCLSGLRIIELLALHLARSTIVIRALYENNLHYQE